MGLRAGDGDSLPTPIFPREARLPISFHLAACGDLRAIRVADRNANASVPSQKTLKSKYPQARQEAVTRGKGGSLGLMNPQPSLASGDATVGTPHIHAGLFPSGMLVQVDGMISSRRLSETFSCPGAQSPVTVSAGQGRVPGDEPGRHGRAPAHHGNV